MASKSWNCPLCSWFGAPSIKGIVRPIGASHAQDANFHICCGISGCPRTYRQFHSYRKHLYRYHKEALDCVGSDTLVAERNILEEHNDDSDLDDQSEVLELECQQPLSLKQAGLFLLKIREIYKVTQSDQESLTADISNVELTMKHLENRVKSQLNSMGIGMNNELQQIFCSPALNRPFHGLHTEF